MLSGFPCFTIYHIDPHSMPPPHPLGSGAHLPQTLKGLALGALICPVSEPEMHRGKIQGLDGLTSGPFQTHTALILNWRQRMGWNASFPGG